MTGNEVRKRFLEYFSKKGHEIVKSSSLVPMDDPTLLFVNAGMVQFKRIFLGEEKRGYQRATTAQKCVRAGGKHNDLENVGYTARHHTFFEMLGNFSFGDYFKEKAIEFGWDLLTNGYGLPEERLWVSIYEDDDEAARIWQKNIGVPEEKIARFGEKDNFWAMGDTGPCGPCSEIHLDRGEEFGCGRPDCRLGCDCDRWLELWNLVFMQFNRDADGKQRPLPKPSIDTGMGLERMASVIQNVPTNFDTDLIRPIMNRTEELCGIRLGESEQADVAMKVIADHSRAAAFLIGDGVMPSKDGRGYVLRRIMRRAIRYGRFIGLSRPFLYDTAGVVIKIMQDAYPELKESSAFIQKVIKEEEIRFSETLDAGLRILNDTIEEVKASGKKVIPGRAIFRLYDTYGFPVDIVRDVLREEDIRLDLEGYEKEMELQRQKSRSKISFAGVGEAFKGLTSEGFVPEFSGYSTTADRSEVVWLVKDNAPVGQAGPGDRVRIVVKRTPFYGEAGGQIGDTGIISAQDKDGELLVYVENTVKDPTGLIIHEGIVKKGKIRLGQEVELEVDEEKRRATSANHTATHILHSVLREVLGEHVKQAGSLVAPDRFRFDFTHFSQLQKDEMLEIERRVNSRILEDLPVMIDEMDFEEAFSSGATALFEEKYGDKVRVITLGDYSRELCGGTHAPRTGRIGLFKILSESSLASGIRRIEAVTGMAALLRFQEIDGILKNTAMLLKDKPEAILGRVEKLLGQVKGLEKNVEQLKEKLASLAVSGLDDQVRVINGVKTIIMRVVADSPAALRNLADRYKEKLGSGIVVLGTENEGKVMLIAGVTKDLTGRFHAGNIVKEAASVVGGGGGGRPDMAQAGGSMPENLDKALELVQKLIDQG